MSKHVDRRSFLKQAAILGGVALLPVGDLMLSRHSAAAFLSPGGVNLDRVWLSPGFKVNNTLMSDRLKQIIINWIPWCYNQLNNTSLAEGGIDNFVQAANKLAGRSYKPHVGYWFSNAYVLNIFESMCIACMLDPQGDSAISSAQNTFKSNIANWMPKILAACESDGYMQTWTTLGNNARWTDRGAHEGYVAGYFIDAGIAHYLMTGKTDATFYNAAKKLADCWNNNIGPSPKRTWWDGHQNMEQCLCNLARFVNMNEGGSAGNKYYQLAKFLMDVRYSNSSGTYDQSHAYPINQTTAVGHAVRAVYLYSGMIDVAMLANNTSYYNAVNAIWDNLINRKLYITGGVGSGETSEGFGADYSLPNSAYCESCSGCGHLYFQHKMMMAYQDAKYADLYELTYYNAILGDLDLTAKNFCYTNPLTQNFARYNWHSCPCCVGNIPRTLLSFPTWMYATGNGGLYINMFIGSTVLVPNVGGTTVQVVQSTNYPWDGNVSITINPATSANFTVRVRAPNRDVGALYNYTPVVSGFTSISLNGSAISPTMNKGYAEITRTWVAGDRINIVLPMDIQRVNAISNVSADAGRVAIQRGPLIYSFESVDQSTSLTLDSNAPLTVQWNASLLNGVNTIKGNWNNGAALTGIPNYARNNRGGTSYVWMLERKVAGTPTTPPPTTPPPTTPPPQTNPVVWYKFEGDANDSSGNGKNATVAGGTYVAGKDGQAINLSGSSQYVSLPSGVVSNLGDFSIATWVKLTALGTWSRLFDFGTGTSVNMFLTPQSGAGVRFAITNSGAGAEQRISGSSALATGTWVHVAVTKVGNTGTLYVNGASVGTNTSMTLSPSSLGSTGNNWLGRSQYSSDPYLNGQIDDFRIYNRGLSASEVQSLASSIPPTTPPPTTPPPQTNPTVWYPFDGNANDSSGNGKNATVTGGTYVTGKTGQAIDLSGSSQYVTLPVGVVSGLNDFTISTWVKLDTTGNWRRIFDFGSSTSVNMFLVPTNGSVIRFAITTSGASAEQRINGTSALPTGTWKHVAVTLSGSTGRLYVDGVQVGQNTSMTLKPSSLGSTSNNWLGRSQYSADAYLDGQIDQFRIYNHALSASEVLALFQTP